MSAGLDIEQPAALVDYLRQAGHIGPVESPEVQPLAGGVSNRTVLVRRANGDAWVLKQALEKLRVAVDWFSSPQRIHREAAGLRWLARLAPTGAVPALIFEDHYHHVLAMTAVAQPHENWKHALLDGRLATTHVEQFARLLATIHRRASEAGAGLRAEFEDRSFFESLRLEPYYAYSASQVPAASRFLHALIGETLAVRVTLVHGDYSPKNILIHAGQLVLLDHEVIHFGDPAFDVGFSLTHLLSKAHHLPAQRRPLVDAARLYWEVYRAALGPLDWAGGLEPRAARHTLGCLLARVAGRSQLEYLSRAARAHQAAVVVRLMRDPPMYIPDLIARFITGLDHADD